MSGKVILLVASVLVIGVATFTAVAIRGFHHSFGSTAEDRRRTDIMAEDPMLHLDLVALTSTETLTTAPGGGTGPWAHQSIAFRDYTSLESPELLAEPLIEAAENAGWAALTSRALDEGGGRHISASRADHGFGASLSIHIRPRQESGSAIRVLIQTQSATVSPPQPPRR